MKNTDDGADVLGRRTVLGLAVLVPALGVGIVCAEPPTAVPADLAEAMDAYYRATLANDTAALGALLTVDYLLVNSDSSVQDKPSYLADFLAPGFQMDAYVMQEPVHRVWGDTALTGGIQPLGWTQEGEHHTRLLRVAHVWVRRARHWQLAYTHLTRVPN